MSAPERRAIVLWTGGKDSCLALHLTADAGLEIAALVTFTPREPRFLAHPLELIRLQAESLGIPHRTEVVDPPYADGYRRGLQRAAARAGAGAIVTGDIDRVDGHDNFIAEHARALSLHAVLPLWQWPRERVLRGILEQELEVAVSCVRARELGAAWIGRRLDAAAQRELLALAAAGAIDSCGENGEYHTMVLDGRRFRRRIRLDGARAEAAGDLWHLAFERASAEAKP